MRNFTWNRFPIKNLLIDSLLTPIVESTYLNVRDADPQQTKSNWTLNATFFGWLHVAYLLIQDSAPSGQDIVPESPDVGLSSPFNGFSSSVFAVFWKVLWILCNNHNFNHERNKYTSNSHAMLCSCLGVRMDVTKRWESTQRERSLPVNYENIGKHTNTKTTCLHLIVTNTTVGTPTTTNIARPTNTNSSVLSFAFFSANKNIYNGSLGIRSKVFAWWWIQYTR